MTRTQFLATLTAIISAPFALKSKGKKEVERNGKIAIQAGKSLIQLSDKLKTVI
jgi:hypothetical protein